MRTKSACVAMVVSAMILALAGPAKADLMYSQAVQSQHPVAFWEFEDANSNNGSTAASTVNSATYNGTYYAGTGHQVTLGVSAPGLGQAAYFHNGSGAVADMDRVIAPNTGFPVGSAERTVTFWAQTSATNYSLIMEYGAEAAGQGWCAFMNPTGYIQVSQWGDSAMGPSPSNDGMWHFHAITTKNGTWTVYTDGVAGTPYAMPTDTVLNASTMIGVISSVPSSSWTGWNGGLDEIAVFNKALTATEIGYLYTGTSVPEPSTIVLMLTGLLAYAWRKLK